MRGVRECLQLISAALVVATVVACSDGPTRDLQKLNIVLIVVGTLRVDRTPVKDPSAEGMPFLAELAARSVVFERAYSSSSYTAPATASIFTSRYPSEHGVWNGFTVYDELVKVPLLFLVPGVEPRRVRDLVSVLDVMPTLRAIAGMPPQPADAGENLLPSLRGASGEDRTLFAMRLANWEGEPEPRAIYAVIHGGWKYIVALPDSEEERYDLTADPAEQRNALEENEQIARDLAAKLAAIRTQVETNPRSFTDAPEVTPEMREHLESLGYIE